MTNSNTPFTSALGGLDAQIGDAGAALKALEAPAAETAGAIDVAFAKAGDSLAKSLAKAASDGKISLSELASAIIGAVDQAAGMSSSSGSLSGVLSQIFSAAGNAFSGARADGGPVLPGGAYIVGERGPEVFRPDAAGSIGAASGQTVNITLNVGGGADGLVRSEAQVASALNRAARMGLR